MDVTIAEIAAKIPANDSLKAWVQSWGALPDNATPAEFLAKFMQAAYRAQVDKNAAALAADPNAVQITAYSEPANGAVTLDVPTGLLSYPATYSVNVRIPVDLDNSIATLQ